MRWPRRPVAGLFALAVGGSAAGVLTLMLGGAAMILIEPEEALAWATAITERRQAIPSFYDGLRAQVVADSVLDSHARRSWIDIPPEPL